MSAARATAIFDAEDSQLRAAYLRADKGLMMMQKRFAAVKSFLVGMAPVAAVMGGIAKVSNVLDAGKELADTSMATGLATADILKMRKEFKLAGRDASEIAPAVQKMQKALVNGTGDKALQKLGLNLQALRKLSPAEQFHQIGKAIAGMADPAERTAAAMAIFGKTGATMLPVFQQKGFGDAKLKKGDQLMAQDAELFAETKNKITTLKPQLDSLFIGMADKIIPVFRPLLDRIEKYDFATKGQELGDPIAQAIQLVSDGETWSSMVVWTKLAAAQCMAALEEGFASLPDLLVKHGPKFLSLLMEGFVALGKYFVSTVDSVVSKIINASTTLRRNDPARAAGAAILDGLGHPVLAGMLRAIPPKEVERKTNNQKNGVSGSPEDELRNKTKKISSDASKSSSGKDDNYWAKVAKELQKESDAFMDPNYAKMQKKSEESRANAKGTPGAAEVDKSYSAPVVSSLQRIGGDAGAGGGSMENLMRDSVSVARSSMSILQGIHDSLTSQKPAYALLA
jgi:hypothetical protein